MKIDCDWNGKSKFMASINGFRVNVDGTKKIEKKVSSVVNPLDLALFCAAAGANAINQLKGHGQVPEKFSVEIYYLQEPDIIKLNYKLSGACDPTEVLKAIRYSQKKHFEDGFMSSVGATHTYEIFLNNKRLDLADFEFFRDVSPCAEGVMQ